MKRDTGFYAKQILLGTDYNRRGLLYWLWVTDDHAAIKATLQAWADQRDGSWDEAESQAKLIGPRGRYHISVDDLQYVPDEACRKVIADAIASIKPRE